MNHHECPREHWKPDGRWYGPSMGTIACDRYTPKPSLLGVARNAANPKEDAK